MTQRQAFFLPAEKGQRFCIFTPSLQQPARAAVLYLHPFAEELNKSRRMIALQVRELAAAGFDVLQIDLFGCGDSSGDFADANWADWLADGQLALDWLRENSPGGLCLWGLRCGALLASDIARRQVFETALLFWQPVLSGANVVRDFLRLAVAGDLMSGHGKEKLSDMRSRLAAGGTVEVAGYRLSAAMADQLSRVPLTCPSDYRSKRVFWLEIGSETQSPQAPATKAVLAQLQAAGSAVCYRALPGAPFWQTGEIELVPALIDETVALMTGTENA
ncbi:hydrolase 2, exosortase A system-associated [Dechloromonas sp. ARDL1]|uniref:hydrolase 2, exosortase A system-associated n=1 Tax=Dechloromonas sp. ARDL1 TaxID=3322121 RepID=UPI003DA76BEF